MPCYVTYKIKTQIKATDVEMFKAIAKEQYRNYYSTYYRNGRTYDSKDNQRSQEA